MRIRIWKGDRPSAGCRALAAACGAKVLRAHGGRYRPRHGDIIVNWGTTNLPIEIGPARVLNDPRSVMAAVDKVTCLGVMREHIIPHVQFTTDINEARTWSQEGHVVIVRTLTRASGGDGLVVIPSPDTPMPIAPLYTRYFRGREEYRIHVLGGQVIDRQQKRLREDLVHAEQPRQVKVRNLANGWVFCREDLVQHHGVDAAAVRAVAALGLDFGAVDLKRGDKKGAVAVLEVNTAPGLEGQTLNSYAQALRGLE